MGKRLSTSTRTSKLFEKFGKVTQQITSSAEPEPVHDLRTTARRIETLLSAREIRGTKKLSKQLARLRRRAGKLRDTDVHLEALSGVRLENDSHDRVAVRNHITKLRRKHERKLVGILKDEFARGLSKRMKRALRKVQADAGSVSRRDYAYESLSQFKTLVEKFPLLNQQTLHDFRIACKRIRYFAEMDPTPDSDRVLAALKRIQDAVGIWHDWLTLTEVARRTVSKHPSALMAALRAQTTSKFNEALRITTQARKELLEIAVAQTTDTSLKRRNGQSIGAAAKRNRPGSDVTRKPRMAA